MEAVDWGKIRTEYVTGSSSYQDLADKYHVNKCTVARHGRKERWAEERNRYAAELHTKAAKKIENRQAERMAKLHEAADALLGKIAEAVDTADGQRILNDPRLARALTGALMDLKDVLGCKSELDTQEQMARIEKLRQKDESGPSQIRLTVEGGRDYGC